MWGLVWLICVLLDNLFWVGVFYGRFVGGGFGRLLPFGWVIGLVVLMILGSLDGWIWCYVLRFVVCVCGL